jgi:hypothetical protein
MMTSTSLLGAAFLTFAIGAVHSWLGERRLIGPLLSKEQRCGILAKSAFARGVLRFAWHLTTVAWWGIGLIVAALAFSPIGGQGRLVLGIVAATFLVTGGVILVTSRGRHLAWPVFFAIAGLSALPLLQAAP